MCVSYLQNILPNFVSKLLLYELLHTHVNLTILKYTQTTMTSQYKHSTARIVLTKCQIRHRTTHKMLSQITMKYM